MKQPQRSSLMDGVKVLVVMFEMTFNVFVEIDEGCNLAKRRKNKYFSIKFHTTGKVPVTTERISLKLNRIEYPASNFVVNFKQTISMPNGMNCTLSLYPEFYLPKSLLKIYKKQCAKGMEKIQRKKMKKADEKALARFYRTASYGSSASRPSSQASINGRPAINYSRNNVGKPYQGGGCTPK